MVEIIVCEIACWLINRILATDLALPAEVHLRLKSKLQESLQIMSTRGEDVLASVPQGLGLISVLESQNSANSPSHTYVSGGYMLTWNLYTVGKSPIINYETRQWIIKQLKGISKSAGVGIAMQLAQDIGEIDLMAN
jgi:hypothetical protein